MRIEVNGETAYCYTNSRNIEADKPTVVFIHGAGMDHTVWTLASRHFARHGNNVVSVDLPGHGRDLPFQKTLEGKDQQWVDPGHSH